MSILDKPGNIRSKFLDSATEEELKEQLKIVQDRKQQEIADLIKKLEALGYTVTK
jgi:hypothetical protein